MPFPVLTRRKYRLVVVESLPSSPFGRFHFPCSPFRTSFDGYSGTVRTVQVMLLSGD